MTTIEHTDVPIPSGDGITAVAPPGAGEGFWAGGPSACLAPDGSILLAYRLRRPVDAGRGYAVVVARATDAVTFAPLVTLHKDDFHTASFERPALVARPGGGWRLYLSCSTPDSYHWWIDAIDASDPSAFSADDRRTVFPGDERTAMKDPVVRASEDGWTAWVCCHPLEDPHSTDRMVTRVATSADGLAWSMGGIVLAGTSGSWDERGARVSAVFDVDDRTYSFYDGRRDARENWFERTGLAVADTGSGRLSALGSEPVATSPDGTHTLRYVSVVSTGDGTRLYYEASRPDGANEIRTELVGGVSRW